MSVLGRQPETDESVGFGLKGEGHVFPLRNKLLAQGKGSASIDG